MKTYNYIILIIISLFIGACDKSKPIIEETPPPTEEKNEIFELEWATRIDFDEEIGDINDGGVVYKNWYVYTGDLHHPATIYKYNTDTGEQEVVSVLNELKTSIVQAFLFDNIYVCRNAFYVFGYNLDTDQVEWVKDFTNRDENLGRGTIAGNGMYYFLTDEDFKGFNHTQHIYEFDPLTGENRLVYSKKKGDIGLTGASPPAYYSNGKEEFLLFNEFPDRNVPDQSTQNLVAINLETLEIAWRVEDFTEFFASNGLHPPVIYEDIVITGGDWSIYAFDINSGEQLWRYQLPGYNFGGQFWTTTNHSIHEDKLYINPLSDEVLCLNPRTGTLIWNNPKGGPNCTDNMVYYEKEDLLVFTSWGYGSVMVLDALTGETLHREHRYDNSSYNNDVAYDPKTDMFFTSTYKHAVGFKIQRP